MRKLFSPNVALSDGARSQLAQALLRAQADSVRPVAFGLGVLYAVFALLHWLALPSEDSARMTFVAGLSALIYFAIYGYLRARVLPDAWVYPLSLTLYAGAVLNGVLHLYFSDDLLPSVGIALCLIGAGIFLLSRRWLAAALGLTLASWGWLVWTRAPLADAVYFSLLLGGATVIASLAFILRRRTLLRVETLRLDAQAHAAELERAVAAARRTEKSLHETEARYRNLVEQLPAATFIDALDANATTLYISPQIQAMTGYTPTEWMTNAQLWENILHSADRARVLEATRLHNESGVLFDQEYRLLARDGRVVWVHDKAVLVRDAQGKGLYSQGYLADITPRKLAEERARRREAILEAVSFAATAFLRAPRWEQQVDETLLRLGQAAQTSRVYIFESHTDAQGTLLTSIRYEWTAPGIMPLNQDGAFQNLPIIEAGYERWVTQFKMGLAVHGRIRDFPANERALSAQQQILSIATVPIFVGAEWWGCIGLDSCVEEREWSQAELDALQTAADMFGAAIQRERAEQTLAEARDQAVEASRLKSDFLAMMSHEIRTPLNSIVGMSELLLETGLTTEQRDYIKLARHAADALLVILNDILDFSKIEAGKLSLELVNFHLPDLMRMAQEVIEPQARAKGLNLRSELTRELPEHFIGDAGRIRQTLFNLLSNAIKFTMQGEIALTVRPILERAGASVSADTLWLRFEVRDTGIGLSESARARLFEPFMQADMSITRRFGGTGLGLAISKRLIELMGGEIGVESVEGMGSTFWFTLPLQVTQDDVRTFDASSQELGCADPAMTARISQVARVLVVEDNTTNQRLAQLQLSKLGIKNVSVARTGADALMALAGARRMGAPYTLILMDCQMPDMDGFETTRALRALEQADGRRVPIVAITANVMPGAREACLAAGMDDYLSKPVRLNMLQRVLARWHALPDAVAMRTDARRDVSAMAPLVTWDPATLENFRAMETAETAGATDQLLETFMAETGAQLEKMEAGLRDKDFESLRRAAHSIKGAAASLGAYELTARAAKIEELVKNQSDQGLAELLPDLRDEFERVKAALKMELQRKTR